MNIYGFTVINSGGWSYGKENRESYVKLFSSIRERNEVAYKHYVNLFNQYAENGFLVEVDEYRDLNDMPLLSEDVFIKRVEDNCFHIQFDDHHIQFEFWMEECS